MPTVQDQVLNSFYGKLSSSKEVDDADIDALRKLLASGKKLKADDFVVILSGKAKENAL